MSFFKLRDDVPVPQVGINLDFHGICTLSQPILLVIIFLALVLCRVNLRGDLDALYPRGITRRSFLGSYDKDMQPKTWDNNYGMR